MTLVSKQPHKPLLETAQKPLDFCVALFSVFSFQIQAFICELMDSKNISNILNPEKQLKNFLQFDLVTIRDLHTYIHKLAENLGRKCLKTWSKINKIKDFQYNMS